VADLLSAFQAALATLSDDELAALAAGTYAESARSPGLMAWLEHLADWERHRRIAVELPLMPPEAAIDESEADDAIATAIVLRDAFAAEPEVYALLVAVVVALAGTRTRQ
jgi:hypothetical protein